MLGAKVQWWCQFSKLHEPDPGLFIVPLREESTQIIIASLFICQFHSHNYKQNSLQKMPGSNSNTISLFFFFAISVKYHIIISLVIKNLNYPAKRSKTLHVKWPIFQFGLICIMFPVFGMFSCCIFQLGCIIIADFQNLYDKQQRKKHLWFGPQTEQSSFMVRMLKWISRLQ